MNLNVFAKQVERFAVNNSPAILTAIGVTGTIATAIFSAKAGIKATTLIRNEEDGAKAILDPKEAFKLTWKLYIPAAAMATATIVCIVGSNHISANRAMAVATAYSLSEKAFVEYKEKVVQKLGEKNEQAVCDDVARDRVENNPLGSREVIVTGSGDVLCYDSLTGRYFQSNMESLRKAQNDINEQILNFMYASLSDFYEVVGLPVTSYSEEVGWSSNKMLKLSFSAVLAQDNRPCIVVEYSVEPVRNYDRLG